MKYVIGVDGGGTKTAFALADLQGKILCQIVLPSISYREHGMERVSTCLREGVAWLLNAASASAAQVVTAAVGVPCYGENPQEDLVLEHTVQEALGQIPVVIVNDAQNAYYGALSCGCGINVVAGTGSIAYGEDENGRSARSGGWSERFSDEGSCYWLGRMTMGLFCKQADGRLPKAALYHILTEALSLKNDMEFIEVVEQRILPIRSEVAQFQKYLLQAAKAGDVSARELYVQACRELTQLAMGVKNQLDFQSPVNVSLTGGLSHAEEFVAESLRRMLAEAGMVYVPCMSSPVEGAVLLACRHAQH